MINKEKSTLQGLFKKCVREVFFYSNLVIVPLTVLVLTVAFANSEKNRLKEVVNQLAATIKPKIQIGDEIEIQSFLLKILETSGVNGLSVFGDNIQLIFVSNTFTSSDFEKYKNLKLSNILFSRNISYQASFQLYPNSNSTFFIKVVLPNKTRIRILIYSILTSFVMSFLFSIIVFNKMRMVMLKISGPLNLLTDYIENYDRSFSKNINDNQDQNIYEIKNIKERFESLQERNKILHQQILKSETDLKLTSHAKQLSHDIRSPLAALRVVKDMGASEMAPELSKLLGMSIDRITDIANTILPKEAGKKHESENIAPCFLWMLVDQIISEKRVEYKNESNISIQFESDQSPFLMNAFCDSTEFMRSVSNMINNSIEARVSNLPIEIKVRLHESGDQIVLSIVDNGKGIPSEVLSKVFDESFSHGKKEGTGLGLYQVKQAIESWGGKIDIESRVNVGTTLTLYLKKSKKPIWLTEPIEIRKYDSIVVLDDEEYVFTILEDRFSEYGKKIEYYKSIMDFESKLGNQSKDTLYLMDHDLKQNQTGLELIEKYQLQKQAILLTGNYDDKSVQQTAIKINAKILPKPLIHDLPIVS